MRRLIPLLLALAAAVCAPAARAAGWTPTEDDALLFELRSGPLRLGDGMRGYQRQGDQCVVLADMILALDLPIRLDHTAGRASGWVFGEGETIALDRRAGTIALAGSERPLPPDAISDVPEGWCVGTAALGGWLGVTLRPDLPNASLVVESARKLPFQLAAERRARAATLRPRQDFDLATLPQVPTRYAAWRTPAVDVIASAGATGGGARPRRSDLRYEVFASGEVADVSVDARLSSDDQGAPARLRARAYRADPDGGLPLGATRIEGGDVTGVASPLAVASVIGRGATITNRPLTQPDSFSTTSLHGDLPSGWEAELYRNGQLLAFAEPRGDGRYEFQAVPLTFGSNRFEIVLYGPQGQVRRRQQGLRVDADSIPPQRTRYWLSATDADRDLLALRHVPRGTSQGPRASLGLERGLSRRTSVFAFAHSYRVLDRRASVLELGGRQAFGGLLAQLSGAADASGGWAARFDALGGGERTSWSLQALAAHDFTSDRFTRDLSAEVTATVDSAFGPDTAPVPVHGELRWRSDRGGRQRSAGGVRASHTVARFYLTGELDWNRARRRRTGLIGPGVDVSGLSLPTVALRTLELPATIDDLSAAFLASGSVGRVRLRAAARFAVSPRRRLDTLEANAEWAAGERGQWRAELGWATGLGGRGIGRIAIGHSRRFDRFALGGRIEAATDGGLAAGIDLQFSLAPRPGGGVRLGSARYASQGRAEVVVFRDLNGDGVRQPDEPPERDVQLVAGQATAARLTDAAGRATVEDLVPYRAVLIGIDAASLPDPFLLPAGPGKVVVPRPGIASTVELPVVGSGAVEGELVSAAGAGLGGVDLELVDPAGVVAATTRSEFDGHILFERVPYGRFTLRIGALAAAALKANAALGRTVEVTAERPIAELGSVTATTGRAQAP